MEETGGVDGGGVPGDDGAEVGDDGLEVEAGS